MSQARAPQRGQAGQRQLAAHPQTTSVPTTRPFTGSEPSFRPGPTADTYPTGPTTTSTTMQLPTSVAAGLPPPPTASEGSEQMLVWLRAKAGDDRRILEEEKTRQEFLKLEQRKVERDMITEALRGGVPPQSIPSIFVNPCGSASVTHSPGGDRQWMYQTPSSQSQAYHQQIYTAGTQPSYYSNPPSAQYNAPFYYGYGSCAYPATGYYQNYPTYGYNNSQSATASTANPFASVPQAQRGQCQSLGNYQSLSKMNAVGAAPSSTSQHGQVTSDRSPSRSLPTAPSLRLRVPSGRVPPEASVQSQQEPVISSTRSQGIQTQGSRDVPIPSIEQPVPRALVHVLPSFTEVYSSPVRSAPEAWSVPLETTERATHPGRHTSAPGGSFRQTEERQQPQQGGNEVTGNQVNAENSRRSHRRSHRNAQGSNQVDAEVRNTSEHLSNLVVDSTSRLTNGDTKHD